MAQNAPMHGPHTFLLPTGDKSDARAAHALEFVAQRVAGIEWQLAELNEKLLQIAAHLKSMASKH